MVLVTTVLLRETATPSRQCQTFSSFLNKLPLCFHQWSMLVATGDNNCLHIIGDHGKWFSMFAKPSGGSTICAQQHNVVKFAL